MRIRTAAAATVLSVGALLGTGAAPASAAPNGCFLIFYCTPESKIDKLVNGDWDQNEKYFRVTDDIHSLRKDVEETKEDAGRTHQQLGNQGHN
ncbi:hypothetical protein ACFYOI_14715 [Streptomyces microflavus]|uniref:hypothetical protein n=1 Tax=Streptomyces microflavus TaxID=1919 RepID=UPI0033B3E248